MATVFGLAGFVATMVLTAHFLIAGEWWMAAVIGYIALDHDHAVRRAADDLAGALAARGEP